MAELSNLLQVGIGDPAARSSQGQRREIVELPQRSQSASTDRGQAELERRQGFDLAQRLHARISHGRLVQIDHFQMLETAEVGEAGTDDLGTAEIEVAQVVKTRKRLEAAVGDPRTP